MKIQPLTQTFTVCKLNKARWESRKAPSIIISGISSGYNDGLDFDGLFQKISRTFRYYFENENFRMFRNILMISCLLRPGRTELRKDDLWR